MPPSSTSSAGPGPVDGPRSVTAVAPAKINLHLAVGDLRDDGFHDLVTVYRALDMWETVTVSWSDVDSLTVSGPDHSLVPTDRTNLAARAVDLLRARHGGNEQDHTARPVAIHIDKGVPVAGGMAGGSADAAAALVAADRLFGTGLSRDELETLAAELGSDIPFCVRGGTVLGTGRGELLAPVLRAETPSFVVVATARGGLSTPECYRELDRRRADPASSSDRLGEPDDLLAALAQGGPAEVAAHVGNDMEAAALSLRPELRRTLRAGREAGALAGMVSGSGPTCLFFCTDDAHAVDVAAALAETGTAREVRVTRGPVGGAHVTSAV